MATKMSFEPNSFHRMAARFHIGFGSIWTRGDDQSERAQWPASSDCGLALCDKRPPLDSTQANGRPIKAAHHDYQLASLSELEPPIDQVGERASEQTIRQLIGFSLHESLRVFLRIFTVGPFILHHSSHPCCESSAAPLNSLLQRSAARMRVDAADRRPSLPPPPDRMLSSAAANLHSTSRGSRSATIARPPNETSCGKSELDAETPALN